MGTPFRSKDVWSQWWVFLSGVKMCEANNGYPFQEWRCVKPVMGTPFRSKVVWSQWWVFLSGVKMCEANDGYPFREWRCIKPVMGTPFRSEVSEGHPFSSNMCEASEGHLEPKRYDTSDGYPFQDPQYVDSEGGAGHFLICVSGTLDEGLWHTNSLSSGSSINISWSRTTTILVGILRPSGHNNHCHINY